VITDIIAKGKSYYDIISLFIGTVIQFVIGVGDAKNRIKFTLFVIISSLIVAIYIITPIITYFNIKNVEVMGSLYVFSSVVSVQIFSALLTILPDVITDKILFFIGVDKNDYTKEKTN